MLFPCDFTRSFFCCHVLICGHLPEMIVFGRGIFGNSRVGVEGDMWSGDPDSDSESVKWMYSALRVRWIHSKPGGSTLMTWIQLLNSQSNSLNKLMTIIIYKIPIKIRISAKINAKKNYRYHQLLPFLHSFFFYHSSLDLSILSFFHFLFCYWQFCFILVTRDALDCWKFYDSD